MFRSITLTGVLAAAIAFAPVTAPTAQARDNADRFIIGVTALGILGAILHESNKRDREVYQTHTPRKKVHKPRKQTHTHDGRHRHGNIVHKHVHGKGHHHGSHVKRRGHSQVDKRVCLRQKWTRNGWVKFYSQPCLKKHGIRY